MYGIGLLLPVVSSPQMGATVRSFFINLMIKGELVLVKMDFE
jgi:hypothetical protein